MDSTEVARLGYSVTLPSREPEGAGLSPIILLHGVTSTKETWDPFKQELADKTGRKVYALDARNHGDSDWKDDFSYRAMARDLSHFMDEMKISSAVIIGHSMGGKTAMVLATTEPSKVERLILEDISPIALTPNHRRFPFFYLKLLRDSLELLSPEQDLDAAKNTVWDYISSNMPEEHRPSRKAAHKHAAATLALEKSADGFKWKINLDAIQKFVSGVPSSKNAVEGVYRGPTLFLYGTESVYNVPNDEEAILKLFPEAKFVAVEGATHLVHYEFPDEFLSAVLDFF